MGVQDIKPELAGENHRQFMKRLLSDLRALGTMLANGEIQSKVRRIGAEQEMFLVDAGGWPAPRAMEILKEAGDPHFTTELGLFNLEANVDPLAFGGDCLRKMEAQLRDLIGKAREAAGRLQTQVVLTGILPTIRKSDLGLENMTPLTRYGALNTAMTKLRGGPYEFRIKGMDELLVKHDNVMLESCNTSFQVHFQAGPEEFARLYNISQVAAAPVLAAATNSPLLFGQRLWSETRVALFEQSVDTRHPTDHMRKRPSRVSFGRGWIRESVLELFQEDISRFRTLIGTTTDEDPFEKLKTGQPPELKALRLHNGTIYRWNRACYGITEGIPHLRIENRILPAGPTPLDEVANAAFWFGLISALLEDHPDITKVMEFDDAQSNFHLAARLGLTAEFTWLGGRPVRAGELILKDLLPLAREGLERGKILGEDIDRYLGVIEERVRSGQTGSQWALLSYAGMKNQGTMGERLGALTKATIARQQENEPVHRWPLARLEDAGGWKHHCVRVEQFMITDFSTVQEDDPIDLVAHLMDWEKVRHVPVEDDEHNLVGLVSYRSLLRVLGRGEAGTEGATLPVAHVMKRNPITVTPETETLTAIELMTTNKIACLPVVKGGRLVGIITEREFMDITAELLREKLRR